MMREIKFRGRYYKKKDALYPKEDKWVYGSLIVLGKHCWIKEAGSAHSYLVISESVGQLTGLKDKNGKDIYEGDIAYNKWTNINDKAIGRNWEVKFGEHLTSGDYYASEAYGWYLESGNEVCTIATVPCDTGEEIEIIGNIYENPESKGSEND